MKRILAVAVLSILALLAVASPAQAEPDPEYWNSLTTAEQHTYINFVYLGAGQEAPYPEQEEEGYEMLGSAASYGPTGEAAETSEEEYERPILSTLGFALGCFGSKPN